MMSKNVQNVNKDFILKLRILDVLNVPKIVSNVIQMQMIMWFALRVQMDLTFHHKILYARNVPKTVSNVIRMQTMMWFVLRV